MEQHSHTSAQPATPGLVLRLADETATKALAAQLAALARAGDVILLSGGLGVGKTAFARHFIRALTRPDQEVPSPSFTLMQGYDSGKGPICHFDFYRLSCPSEIRELGWDEALEQSIILAEWPDRLGNLLPRSRLDIALGFVDALPDAPPDGSEEEARVARLSPHGDWVARLQQQGIRA